MQLNKVVLPTFAIPIIPHCNAIGLDFPVNNLPAKITFKIDTIKIDSSEFLYLQLIKNLNDL
jgi:hypothetical protein